MGDILPIGVHCLDEVEFPFARPVLDGLFPCDGVGDEVVLLEPDERLDAVAAGEAWGEVVLMLEKAARQVGCHAGVERAVALRSQDVDVALHARMMRVSEMECNQWWRSCRT